MYLKLIPIKITTDRVLFNYFVSTDLATNNHVIKYYILHNPQKASHLQIFVTELVNAKELYVHFTILINSKFFLQGLDLFRIQ